jgi:hypothetical protein
VQTGAATSMPEPVKIQSGGEASKVLAARQKANGKTPGEIADEQAKKLAPKKAKKANAKKAKAAKPANIKKAKAAKKPKA